MLTVRDVWKAALNYYISQDDARSNPFEKIPAFTLSLLQDKDILVLSAVEEIARGFRLGVTLSKSGEVSITVEPGEHSLSFNVATLLLGSETFGGTQKRWQDLLQSFSNLVQELAAPGVGVNAFFVLSSRIAPEKMYRVCLWSGYTMVSAKVEDPRRIRFGSGLKREMEEKGVCVGLVFPLSIWDVFANEKNRQEIAKSSVLHSLIKRWEGDFSDAQVGSVLDVILPYTDESRDMIRLIYEHGFQKCEELRQHLQKEAGPLSAEVFSKALLHKIEG